MKKLFKFITIAALFFLSFFLFGKAKNLFGKSHKSQMAKVA